LLNKKERLLTALNHKLPDQVPIHFINIDDISPYLEMYDAADKEELADRLGVCIRRIWPEYRDVLSEKEAGRLSTGLYEDFKPIGLFGTSGGADSYSIMSGNPMPFYEVETVREVEEYPWPDPDNWDFSTIEEKILRYNDKYAIMLGSWNPILDQVFDFFSMDRAMEYLYLRPDLIEATISQIEDFWLKFYRKYFKAAKGKAHIFSMGDDFAGQRGMLIDPEMWREFIKPVYARIFSLAKEYNLYIWFHSCGGITAVLKDLIEIGLDVWETVQVHIPGSEADHIKREYGQQITFFGGINTQQTLPFGTPAEVRQEVRQRIEVLGKGGGYICGPDHHIKPHFPVENVVAMIDEIESFRSESCTA
jgi:uroporphyrinogen decarboxylase